MRVLLLLTATVVALAGCTRKEETTTETLTTEGRYQGVGVYDAGAGWARIKVAPPAEGSRAARLAEDDHVIVVSDSQTGEVRQCGDLSGYCITLNPWTQTLDATRAAPVTLEPRRDDKGRVIEPPVPNAETLAPEPTATIPTTPAPAAGR